MILSVLLTLGLIASLIVNIRYYLKWKLVVKTLAKGMKRFFRSQGYPLPDFDELMRCMDIETRIIIEDMFSK